MSKLVDIRVVLGWRGDCVAHYIATPFVAGENHEKRNRKMLEV
jgi:hypothetical protein